nr:hypothetical protein [Thermosporothrix hazakensis]
MRLAVASFLLLSKRSEELGFCIPSGGERREQGKSAVKSQESLFIALELAEDIGLIMPYKGKIKRQGVRRKKKKGLLVCIKGLFIASQFRECRGFLLPQICLIGGEVDHGIIERQSFRVLSKKRKNMSFVVPDIWIMWIEKECLIITVKRFLIVSLIAKVCSFFQESSFRGFHKIPLSF